MSADSPVVERFQALVARQLAARPGGGPEWLEAQRNAAAQRLAELGMPERRQEAWRYTSVEPLLGHRFEPPPEAESRPGLAQIQSLLLAETEGTRLVFVNGRYAPELCSLERAGAVRLGSLRDALREGAGERARLLGSLAGPGEHAFSALNAVLAHDGALVHIPEGVCLEQPIELLHLSVPTTGPCVTQPRHLVLVEPGARARLVERFVALGEPLYFNNLVSEILLGESAELEHERLQSESPHAFHISVVHLALAAGSRYHGVGAALGAAWSRTEHKLRFDGPGAESTLDGLYLAGDGQMVDVHLDVRHAAPGCTSRESFRGLLDGRGRAVFDARVRVERRAQKSDAQLTNANLMLSRGAEIDTKPQLEIFADDVKCSHGTSVGELDADAVFYLRSRGLSEADARRMLSIGFAREVLDAFRVPGLRDRAEVLLAHRLGAGPQGQHAGD